jgi:CheY-like chemotaxis protein
MRILLAEDDALLGDGLRAGLRQLGFQVDWVRDGLAAERELRAEPYAAAVLDLGLPRRTVERFAAVRAGRRCRCWCSPRATPWDRARGLDMRRRLRDQTGDRQELPHGCVRWHGAPRPTRECLVVRGAVRPGANGGSARGHQRVDAN